MNISIQKVNKSPQRHIAMVIYPGCLMLEAVWPTVVFNCVNNHLESSGCLEEGEKTYHLSFIAEKQGPVTTANGLKLYADYGYDDVVMPVDTLMIPRLSHFLDEMKEKQLREFLDYIQPQVRRIVLICPRIFLLTENRLNQHSRTSRRWLDRDFTTNQYQPVEVEPDKLSIRGDNLSHSIGIPAVMDLALSLVEEDWGNSIASDVAREIRVFKQCTKQFNSNAIVIKEAKDRKDFHKLQTWIVNNPDADLSVESLADMMAMSPRNFSRIFCRKLGITPAKFVERVRLEVARNMMVQTHQSVEKVAAKSGFQNADQMRRTFKRVLKISPLDYRDKYKDYYHFTN